MQYSCTYKYNPNMTVRYLETRARLRHQAIKQTKLTEGTVVTTTLGRFFIDKVDVRDEETPFPTFTVHGHELDQEENEGATT